MTFVAQAKDSLWSVDLFRCESIFLHSHWVMVVNDVYTRRIIGFGIERGSIDNLSVCRLFNHAVAGRPPPKRISTYPDPLFRFHLWLANLRIREIEEVKTVHCAPVKRCRSCPDGFLGPELEHGGRVPASVGDPDIDNRLIRSELDLATIVEERCTRSRMDVRIVPACIYEPGIAPR